MMTIVTTGVEDEKRAEIDCYNYLREIKQHLVFIPNKELKDLYKLNLVGEKEYPQLIGHTFDMKQVENIVFHLGAGVDFFGLAVTLTQQSSHYQK